MRRGKIDHLKSEYGIALAEDSYALVNCELAVRPGGVISSKAPTEAGKAAGAFGAYPSCGRERPPCPTILASEKFATEGAAPYRRQPLTLSDLGGSPGTT